MNDYFRLNEAEKLRVDRLNRLARQVGEGGGGVWVMVESGGTVELRPLSVAATPPSSPGSGDLWVDIS